MYFSVIKNTTTWLCVNDSTILRSESGNSYSFKQALRMNYNYSLAQVWLPL